jgi:D-3-phosphoglycerate dehydrogenase
MKILVTDKSADEALQVLKDAGQDVTYDEMDADTLLKEVGKYDALMIRGRTKVVTDVVNEGAKGNLKVIGRAGIGVDNVDIETAAKHGIPVVNAPTGATASVAELAVAHMLALSRHVTKADSSMKKGEWPKKQLKGNELFSKTIGLIGTGNIGKLTAKYAQCFNMKVIGYDPFISKEDMAKDGIEKVDDLGDLMAKADYISLHLPHMPKTHHIVNENMISKMKSTAFLVNCARGGTVDEKALFNALKEDLDNVVLTPHLGANTKEGQIRAGTVCAEQIVKVLNGEQPDFCVNKHLL